MSGQWITKTLRPHVCQMPVDQDAWAGSVWQCTCGQRWTITQDPTTQALSWAKSGVATL